MELTEKIKLAECQKEIEGYTLRYLLYESPSSFGCEGMRMAYSLEIEMQPGNGRCLLYDITRVRAEAMEIYKRFSEGTVPPDTALELIDDYFA